MAPVFEDCLGAIRLCCNYARDAAEHGRFAAAHGLFQSALNFYERAQKLVVRQDEFSFHDSQFHTGGSELLKTIRDELDECARYVYPEPPAALAPPKRAERETPA